VGALLGSFSGIVGGVSPPLLLSLPEEEEDDDPPLLELFPAPLYPFLAPLKAPLAAPLTAPFTPPCDDFLDGVGDGLRLEELPLDERLPFEEEEDDSLYAFLPPAIAPFATTLARCAPLLNLSTEELRLEEEPEPL
jgi:hypothetical protein